MGSPSSVSQAEFYCPKDVTPNQAPAEATMIDHCDFSVAKPGMVALSWNPSTQAENDLKAHLASFLRPSL